MDQPEIRYRYENYELIGAPERRYVGEASLAQFTPFSPDNRASGSSPCPELPVKPSCRTL
jgi:hypothetical protein